MPREIMEVVGRPFVGLQRAADLPPIVKALDVTDVCPMKYGGRTIVVYALFAGERYVAVIASGRGDPLDGVCATSTVERLTGRHGRDHRQQLYAFARPLGIDPGRLIELVLIHQPSSSG